MSKLVLLCAGLCVGVVGCSSATAASGAGRPQFIVPSTGATPFSGVVRAGNILFVAGQIGTDSAKGGIAGETASAMDKIAQLLKQAGSGLDHVAKCTVMLADMKEWAAMNEVYIKFFAPDKRPARSSFGTTGLAQGARVEIECIAVD